MQMLATWTNLSESTFVLRPSSPEAADYRLRIFTPAYELPFAGHPTVGSAHAALEAGLVSGPTFRQECGAGVLELSVTETDDGRRIFVVSPEATFVREFADVRAGIESSLRVPLAAECVPAAFDNGPRWLFVRL